MKLVNCGGWFSLDFPPLLKTKEVLFPAQASSFLKNRSFFEPFLGAFQNVLKNLKFPLLSSL